MNPRTSQKGGKTQFVKRLTVYLTVCAFQSCGAAESPSSSKSGGDTATSSLNEKGFGAKNERSCSQLRPTPQITSVVFNAV